MNSYIPGNAELFDDAIKYALLNERSEVLRETFHLLNKRLDRLLEQGNFSSDRLATYHSKTLALLHELKKGGKISELLYNRTIGQLGSYTIGSFENATSAYYDGTMKQLAPEEALAYPLARMLHLIRYSIKYSDITNAKVLVNRLIRDRNIFSIGFAKKYSKKGSVKKQPSAIEPIAVLRLSIRLIRYWAKHLQTSNEPAPLADLAKEIIDRTYLVNQGLMAGIILDDLFYLLGTRQNIFNVIHWTQSDLEHARFDGTYNTESESWIIKGFVDDIIAHGSSTPSLSNIAFKPNKAMIESVKNDLSKHAGNQLEELKIQPLFKSLDNLIQEIDISKLQEFADAPLDQEKMEEFALKNTQTALDDSLLVHLNKRFHILHEIDSQIQTVISEYPSSNLRKFFIANSTHTIDIGVDAPGKLAARAIDHQLFATIADQIIPTTSIKSDDVEEFVVSTMRKMESPANVVLVIDEHLTAFNRTIQDSDKFTRRESGDSKHLLGKYLDTPVYQNTLPRNVFNILLIDAHKSLELLLSGPGIEIEENISFELSFPTKTQIADKEQRRKYRRYFRKQENDLTDDSLSLAIQNMAIVSFKRAFDIKIKGLKHLTAGKVDVF